MTTQTASRDELKAVITDALAPLVERLSKMETKLDGLDAHFLPREVADEKINALADELKSIRALIKEQRDAMFRWLGASAAIVSIIVLFAQHVHIS